MILKCRDEVVHLFLRHAVVQSELSAVDMFGILTERILVVLDKLTGVIRRANPFFEFFRAPATPATLQYGCPPIRTIFTICFDGVTLSLRIEQRTPHSPLQHVMV